MTDFDDTLLKAALEAQPIPLGSGIAGYVALTKTGLRIVDAYRVNIMLIGCVFILYIKYFLTHNFEI